MILGSRQRGLRVIPRLCRCSSAVAEKSHNPGYRNILSDLKALSPLLPIRSNLLSKSFADIENLSVGSPESRRSVAWSSAYDAVSRSPFARDVSHLHSLLDALLASKNFDRASSILKAIYPLLEHQDSFIFSINKFLEQWAVLPSVSLADVDSFISKIPETYPGVSPNDRTTAVLLAKHCKLNVSFDNLLRDVQPHRTRKILSHIDILGVDSLAQVFKMDYIEEHHVPTDFIPLFRQVRADPHNPESRPEYFAKEGHQPPTITKDTDDLLSVDTFGLKVIRHTLLGLSLEAKLPELDGFLANLDSPGDHVLFSDAVKRRDFFKVYQSLKTPDHKAQFNAALDLFNEEREKQLEMRGIDGAREKWAHAFEEMQKRGGINVKRGLNAQLYAWYADLLPLLQAEVDVCNQILEGLYPTPKASSSLEERQMLREREYYAPYLVLVPPEKMCVIAILEILKLNGTGGILDGMRTARALLSVGRAFELEFRAQGIMRSEKNTFNKKTRTNSEWRRLVRRQKSRPVDNSQTENEWSRPVCAKVGSVVTSLLLRVAKVAVKATDPTTGEAIHGVQPAFTHTYQFVAGQKIGILRIHKQVVKELAGGMNSNIVQPQLLPMLVPPRRWLTHNDGGYLYSASSILRIKDSAETSAYVKAASSQGNINDVCDGLNVLGETPWAVNRKVFEIITHYWNTGAAILDIPPLAHETIMPSPLPSDAEPHEKFEHVRKVRQIMNDAASARSQRCDTNYKLEIARGFLGEKIFFPHNVDFRGRAYPLLPHFNHLGNDLTRSLFLFWEGKVIGARGFEWLKIHLANVYGVDKAPLSERVEFVESNMSKIIESARNPLAENAWWKSAEKPWQALAACFELEQACLLPDPTQFESHIPIQQDGTCNGLQHYAALGGDIEGARQVNLVPAERPQDVYNFVAKLVDRKIDADALDGNPCAQFLQGKITRKVVKQTVMTNVYGVTFVGAVAQIEKQIAHHFSNDDSEALAKHAHYLTMQVFSSIRELFEGAHNIQDWLGEAARRISKSVSADYEVQLSKALLKPNHMLSVIWTTPLGLPCVQPYRVNSTLLVKTNLQDITILDPFGASQVDARKQQAAFPPNFVHSLDASHMLMTSKSCGERGLSFAAVHDSYWTHACDVDVMNTEIRAQFVKLHEHNLIEMLKDEFEKRYRNCFQVVSVPVDHPIVGEVKTVRSGLAQSLGRAVLVADEIYIETKRLQMLELGDPEQIKNAQQMTTTISVTANHEYDNNHKGKGNISFFQHLVPLTFPQVPSRGDFDVNIVKDSRYFFS